MLNSAIPEGPKNERRNIKFRAPRESIVRLGLSSERRVAGTPFFRINFARFPIFFLAPHVRGVPNKITSVFG